MVKSFGAFSFRSFGTGTLAALLAISPYLADFPLKCDSTPALVFTSLAGTFQFRPAASRSICLAAAPASRSGFQYMRTELLPPVNCAPSLAGSCGPHFDAHIFPIYIPFLSQHLWKGSLSLSFISSICSYALTFEMFGW